MPDPVAQGAEEWWTIYVCRKCGRATTREGERCGGWSRHNGNRYNRAPVEVVPLSRAQEAEAERDKFREIAGRYNAGWEKRCDAVEAERDSLAARLEAVEGAVRRYRNNHTDAVEIVNAIRAALNPEQGKTNT